MRGAAFLRAAGSTNDHDLGLFEIGAQAGASRAGRRTRRALPPGLGGRHPRRPAGPRCRLAEAGALVGASDHSTTKSLYGHDPDGLEFEIAWIVPADRLDEEALAGRASIQPLDLPPRSRATAQTPGGIGDQPPARSPELSSPHS